MACAINVSAFPRLPRAQSALAMTNLLALRHRIRAAKPTACKAVTDRRYRRNWCIPFSRRPVRIGSLAKLSTFHFPFSTRRMPSPCGIGFLTSRRETGGGTMSGGEFDWGGRLRKGIGGAQRFPQNGWKPFGECKGRREPDCDTDGWSRYESRT